MSRKVRTCWQVEEKPIERDVLGYGLARINGIVGVKLELGEEDRDFDPDSAAFLFGKDATELYFRSSFGKISRVDVADDEKSVELARELYAANQGAQSTTNCLLVTKTHLGLPVYRDALTLISQS